MWTLDGVGNWVLAKKETITEIEFVIVAEDFVEMMEKFQNAWEKGILPKLDYGFADNGNGTWTVRGGHYMTITEKA